MLRWIEALLLPPINALLVAVLAALLWKRRRRMARVLLVLATLGLLLQMMPIFGAGLLRSLQVDPALDLASLPAADVVVVLSAEADPYGTEYGKATVGAVTLQRTRYGASVAKQSGLPVLVTGGPPIDGGPAVAIAMRDVLRDEFGVTAPIWVEDRAGTTMENARFASEMLRERGRMRALLVTHAWHMPRARASFERHGIDVIAAPTAFHGPAYQGPKSLLPSHGGLRTTTWALHEILGRVYYALFE